MKKITILLFTTMLLVSCFYASDFKLVGFQSANEVWPYTKYTLYYASHLTKTEWEIFYKRFPEFLKRTESSKMLLGGSDNQPPFTPYAFKWTTFNRAKEWPLETKERLFRGQIEKGDDVFQVVWALGPPERIIWDNDSEVLAYKRGQQALIMDSSKVQETKQCKGCWEDYRIDEITGVIIGIKDYEVLRELGLTRPDRI